VAAQTNTSAATLPTNRYLLIVETSHSMQRRGEGALRVVSDLIASRMRGQLRLGDTIGIWTFNDTLYTGKLPLQDWSEGERSAIADKLTSFLQEQPFEKQGHFDKVLPALLRVVKNSEFITVILISEGSQDFQGTPFDQQINQSYKQWNAQQQQAHMPFVTVLRARRGQFTDYSVTPAPWPVDMPPLPADLVRPKTPPSTPPVASAPKPAAPPMAPPLIISGRKPNPTLVATTNSVVGQPTLPPTVSSEPVTQPAQTKIQPGGTSTPSVPAAAPDQNLSTPATTGPAAILQPPPATQPSPANAESKSAEGLVQESAPAPPPPLNPTLETKPASDNQPSSQSSSKPGWPAGEQDSPTPAPQVATVPVAQGSSPVRFVVIGLALAGAAAGAGLWLWKRRARPAAHVSLITRSLDRDK
jgi:hypothetical protein